MRPFDPRVLSALPEVRPVVAALGAVGLAQGIVAVSQALAIAHLVDAVVRSGTPEGPAMPPALVVAGVVFAVRALLAAAAERGAAAAGLRVSARVRTRLLRRWLSVPADERPDPTGMSTLATEGATSVEPYVARFLPAVVSAVVLPVLVVATITVVDWVSAVVVVLTVPLLPVFAALIGRATEDSTARRWSALQALSGHFLDVVRGLPTLVAYGRAQGQAATVGAVSERHRVATVRTLRLAFLSSAALELLATISVAMVAVTVGLRLAGGSMPLAPGLTAILLAAEAYWPIRRVGTEYHNAADGSGALAAALDDLGEGESPAAPDHPTGAGAQSARSLHRPGVHAVHYTYPGASEPVLAGVDVPLPTDRGLVVLTGPSGSGKTTLLDLLAGVRRPQRGVVHAPRAHLVAQRPLLVPGTLRANLTLGVGRPVTDDELWAALDDVGLRADPASVALDAQLGDDGFGLSAGQRARVALARATLSDAPLVLLDEPTAHLDTASTRLVVELIKALAAQRTVVVVTHRPQPLQVAGTTTVRLDGPR